LYGQAVAAAKAGRINDYAGGLLAEQAATDALLGDLARARDGIQKALATGNNIETMWPASLAAAFSGNPDQASQLAERYRQAAPPAPDVVQALNPALRAGVSLARKDAGAALEALGSSAPYDRVVGPWLGYVRGLAAAAVRDHAHAVTELREVIARRGNLPAHPLHTLAKLQLARSLRDSGQAAEARQAYADFTASWQGGDTRHPLFTAANREAAALRPSQPTR